MSFFVLCFRFNLIVKKRNETEIFHLQCFSPEARRTGSTHRNVKFHNYLSSKRNPIHSYLFILRYRIKYSSLFDCQWKIQFTEKRKETKN